MSSARQAVHRADNLTGFGKRPDFTPSHQLVLPRGITLNTCGNRTNPVSGISCISKSLSASTSKSLCSSIHGLWLEERRISGQWASFVNYVNYIMDRTQLSRRIALSAGFRDSCVTEHLHARIRWNEFRTDRGQTVVEGRQ